MEHIVDTIVIVIFCAYFMVQIALWLTGKLRHKHSLAITMSPHSPAGRGVHNVITCATCFGTWELTGSDYYGTSTLLKGGKMSKHLSDQEMAIVFLEYALSKGAISDEQHMSLVMLTASDPKRVLNMLRG